MMSCKKYWSKCTISATTTLVILGILFILSGGLTILLFDDAFKNILYKKLAMKKGNEAYTAWLKPPIPVYMKYYIFNYTNIEDIKAGAKPVTQIGPYSYRGVIVNNVISSNNINVTYTENYTYFFDPDTSCPGCLESDLFYTPSSPLIAILQTLHDLNITEHSSSIFKFGMESLDKMLQSKGGKLFNNLTAKQIIWGYDDKLLEFFKSSEDTFGWIFKLLGINIPPVSTTFIALQYNGTKLNEFTGNLTLKTGKENIKDVQRVINWRGLPNAPYWTDTYGEMINGTDGSRFKPFIKKTDQLYLFLTFYCRSTFINFESEQSFRGISLYRFQKTSKVFASSTTNPDNKSFCYKKCWPDGILSVGQCLTKSPPHPPVFFSAPHFYQTDRRIQESINGLSPSKELHGSFHDIEPVTGLTMRTFVRLQVNYRILKVPFMSSSMNLYDDEMFFPVMYLESTAIIDKKNSDNIKNGVLLPMSIVHYGQYFFVSIGCILMLSALVIVFKKRRSYKTLKEDVK